MTQALRVAAQALLDQFDAEAKSGGAAMSAHAFRRLYLLRAALAAPQPTADEWVAGPDNAATTGLLVMQDGGEVYSASGPIDGVFQALAGFARSQYLTTAQQQFVAEVEQSARALLSASQEDAEHAAMYRWLRDQHEGSDPAESFSVFCPGQVYCLEPVGSMPGELDEAIRSAMKEKKA